MEIQETSEMLETASAFVNSTGSHIYLTGKAGTGKTTFLKNLSQHTHKRFVTVAPTGIAALNAGGSTIHSMFQLPLGTFLPDRNPSGEFSTDRNLYTQYSLTRKHPMSSAKKQLLRSIDLLIIDEVSMLRADVLDAIDYRMRSVRGNFSKAFGGVQVLMIGDLYQLPPIVKEHEWGLLKRYYHSAYFFEAKALQSEGFIFIELDKVYRQSDSDFIALLNHLRENQVNEADIALLNRHYQPQTDDCTGIVTLTTHNYKAEEINTNQLRRLPGNTFIYRALVEDDFPETLYPITAQLELKLGAQIMFVRNDNNNGLYYNGTLGIVHHLDSENIKVQLVDTDKIIDVSMVTWENKRYSLSRLSKEIEEEVMGTFSQFPVKLAWAVTVHKSQGLTFDKAIVDVGKAFAPGQVYVALSRLRTLDGLILKTQIDPSVINNDELVVNFSKTRHPTEQLNRLLADNRNYYIEDLLRGVFSFDSVYKELQFHIREGSFEGEMDDLSMKPILNVISEAILQEAENTLKFTQQLIHILREGNNDILAERMSKGSRYYLTFLETHISSLLVHIKQAARNRVSKSYLQSLDEVDQLLMKKYEDISKVSIIIDGLVTNKKRIDVSSIEEKRATLRKSWFENATEIASKSGQAFTEKLREKKTRTPRVANTREAKISHRRNKEPKGSSIEKSLVLFRSGKTIDQIATERGLVPGTIEEHLACAVKNGKLPLDEWINTHDYELLKKTILANTEAGIKQIFESLDGKMRYGKIKAVMESLKMKQ